MIRVWSAMIAVLVVRGARKSAEFEKPDKFVHGVKVTNYQRQARVGTGMIEADDYANDEDTDLIWILMFKKKKDGGLDQFCEDIKEDGATCISHGHPDEYGISEAVVKASREVLENVVKGEKDNLKYVDADVTMAA